MHNSEPQGSLAELNKANWAHYISDSSGNYIESVSDLDCLIIWMSLQEMKNPHNQNMSPVVHLMDMDVNIDTMKVTFLTDGENHEADQEYDLKKDANNQRYRSHGAVKGYN
jgi:hypothetical protein